MKIYLVVLSSLMLLLGACSTVVNSHNNLPFANKTEQRADVSIAVFKLKNYTDTPRAGKRAANIAQGVLLSRGYRVIDHIDQSELTLKQMQDIAKKDKASYFLTGGVSEWRYKTGIDGEPAVSLQLALYKTKNLQIVWSTTASESGWGVSSVGTVAQNLIQKMIEK